MRLADGSSFFDRIIRIVGFVPPGPHLISDGIGEGILMFAIAFAGYENSRTDIGNVGISEPRIDADRKYIRPRLISDRTRHPFDHRTNVGSPCACFVKHRPMNAYRARLDLAQHGALQDVTCLVGALAHVDMRIGLVRNDNIGEFAHERRHVRMQIECDRNGDVVADCLAQAREQLALAVLAKFGDHGAVQTEQDAREAVFLISCGLYDRLGKAIKSIPRHQSGWLGRSAEHMFKVPTVLPR